MNGRHFLKRLWCCLALRAGNLTNKSKWMSGCVTVTLVTNLCNSTQYNTNFHKSVICLCLQLQFSDCLTKNKHASTSAVINHKEIINVSLILFSCEHVVSGTGSPFYWFIMGIQRAAISTTDNISLALVATGVWSTNAGNKGKAEAVSLQAYYMPRGLRGWSSYISRQPAHQDGWFVSPVPWQPLPLKKYRIFSNLNRTLFTVSEG